MFQSTGQTAVHIWNIPTVVLTYLTFASSDANMAATLYTCSKKERAEIKFLCAERARGTEIHRTQYGGTLFPADEHGLPDSSVSVTTVLSLLKFRSIVMDTTSHPSQLQSKEAKSVHALVNVISGAAILTPLVVKDN
jgi:hypothetical protein